MPIVIDINGVPRFIPTGGGVPGASALGGLSTSQIPLTEFIGRPGFPPSPVSPALRPPSLPTFTGPVAPQTQLPVLRAPNFTLGPGGPSLSAGPPPSPPSLQLGGPPSQLRLAPPTAGGPSTFNPAATLIDEISPIRLKEGIRTTPTFGQRVKGAVKAAPGKVFGAVKRGGGPFAALGFGESFFGEDLDILPQGIPEPIRDRVNREIARELTKFIPIVGPAMGLSLDLDEKIASGEASQFDKVMKGFLDSTFAAPARIGFGLAQRGRKAAVGTSEFFQLTDAERATRIAEQQQQEQNLAVATDQAVQEIAIPMFQEIFGETTPRVTTTIVPFDLNSTKFPQPPELAPPTRGTNYAGVYEALQKAMPEDPRLTQDFEMQSTLAVLAGFASGLLDISDGNIGKALLTAGLGAVSGKATVQAQQQKAIQQFKGQMQDYWIRIAGVKKSEAESDSAFENRVLQFKNDGLLREYEAEKTKFRLQNGQVVQGKNGQIHIVRTIDRGDGTAQQQFINIQPSEESARIAQIMKVLEPMIGKSKSMVVGQEVARSGDRAKAIGTFITSAAKAGGTYNQLIDLVSQGDPDFRARLSQVGALTPQNVGTASERQKIIANEQEAILRDIIINNPVLLNAASRIVGVLQ